MKVRLHDGGSGDEWIVDVSYVRTTGPMSIFGPDSSKGFDISIPMSQRMAVIQDGTLIISEVK